MQNNFWVLIKNKKDANLRLAILKLAEYLRET